MSQLATLARKTTLIFFVFSTFWIIASDWVVSLFPFEFQHILQTSKGWLFVVITSGLIYTLLKISSEEALKLQHELQNALYSLSKSNKKNIALLESMPVSVWEQDFSEVKQFIDQKIRPTDADSLKNWMDQNPDGVVQMVDRIKVISLGGPTYEIFGIQSEDILSNLKLSNLFTAKSYEFFKQEIVAFWQGKGTIRFEDELTKPNGQKILTSTAMSMPDLAKHDWGTVIVTVEDVTTRSEFQKAIDTFFDLDMNLHIIATAEGTILRVNEGWKTVLGYERYEVEGKRFLDIIHPDDIEPTISEMKNLESGKKTFYFENRYRAKNGKYRLLSWSALMPESGKLIYAVASDITDKKRYEDKLRNAALVINSTSEGVILTDLNGRITEVNTAFTDITGYESSEVLGKTPGVLRSGRHDDKFYSSLWQEVSDKGYWRGEIWNRKKDGEVYPELLTINSVSQDDGSICGYAGIFSDISHLKDTESRLIHISTHDMLTGLANRSLFQEHVERAIKHAQRTNKIAAIILLDLDNFKYVNDSMGFSKGDDLLKQTAVRILGAVRQDDTVARISSDEYAILLEDIDYSKQIYKIIEQLLDQLKAPFLINGEDIYLTASAGISLYPHDSDVTGTLIRNADTALSKAKEQGGGNYQFYSAELTAAAKENLLIENALRTAITKNQFYLVYQPQYNISSGELIGLEVLIRWLHPELGMIPPGKFIPIAEKSTLINEIGNWVLENACKQAASWLEQGNDFGRIAVNLSAPQLMNAALPEMVSEILQASKLPAQKLELEVTETFAMKDPQLSKELLTLLREIGIEIAIDDFGTGYSSLNYLKNLPIDKLKIDQSFIAGMSESADNIAIIDAVISLGKALSLKIIAEGIETAEQSDKLKDMGCELGQGYHYSKPITADRIEADIFKSTKHTS